MEKYQAPSLSLIPLYRGVGDPSQTVMDWKQTGMIIENEIIRDGFNIRVFPLEEKEETVIFGIIISEERFSLDYYREMFEKNMLNLSEEDNWKLTDAPEGSSGFTLTLNKEQLPSLELRTALEAKEIISSPSRLTIPVGRAFTDTVESLDLRFFSCLYLLDHQDCMPGLLDIVLLGLMFRTSPRDVRFVFLDKAKILDVYYGVPHLFDPPVLYEDGTRRALAWITDEIVTRLTAMEARGARSLDGYNASLRVDEHSFTRLLVIITDADEMVKDPEFAAMMRLVREHGLMVGIHFLLMVSEPVPSTAMSKSTLYFKRAIDSESTIHRVIKKYQVKRGEHTPHFVECCYTEQSDVSNICAYLKENNKTSYAGIMSDDRPEPETEDGKKAEKTSGIREEASQEKENVLLFSFNEEPTENQEQEQESSDDISVLAENWKPQIQIPKIDSNAAVSREPLKLRKRRTICGFRSTIWPVQQDNLEQAPAPVPEQEAGTDGASQKVVFESEQKPEPQNLGDNPPAAAKTGDEPDVTTAAKSDRRHMRHRNTDIVPENKRTIDLSDETEPAGETSEPQGRKMPHLSIKPENPRVRAEFIGQRVHEAEPVSAAADAAAETQEQAAQHPAEPSEGQQVKMEPVNPRMDNNSLGAEPAQQDNDKEEKSERKVKKSRGILPVLCGVVFLLGGTYAALRQANVIRPLHTYLPESIRSALPFASYDAQNAAPAPTEGKTAGTAAPTAEVRNTPAPVITPVIQDLHNSTGLQSFEPAATKAPESTPAPTDGKVSTNKDAAETPVVTATPSPAQKQAATAAPKATKQPAETLTETTTDPLSNLKPTPTPEVVIRGPRTLLDVTREPAAEQTARPAASDVPVFTATDLSSENNKSAGNVPAPTKAAPEKTGAPTADWFITETAAPSPTPQEKENSKAKDEEVSGRKAAPVAPILISQDKFNTSSSGADETTAQEEDVSQTAAAPKSAASQSAGSNEKADEPVFAAPPMIRTDKSEKPDGAVLQDILGNEKTDEPGAATPLPVIRTDKDIAQATAAMQDIIGATDTATETPEPAKTAAPTETPKPTKTAAPTKTPKPAETAVATETPKPVNTDAPDSAFLQINLGGSSAGVPDGAVLQTDIGTVVPDIPAEITVSDNSKQKTAVEEENTPQPTGNAAEETAPKTESSTRKTSAPVETAEQTETGTAASEDQQTVMKPENMKDHYGVGDSGSDIILIKQRLLELGYYSEYTSFNESYNNYMAMHVRNFQRDYKLPETGEIGPEELRILFGE